MRCPTVAAFAALACARRPPAHRTPKAHTPKRDYRASSSATSTPKPKPPPIRPLRGPQRCRPRVAPATPPARPYALLLAGGLRSFLVTWPLTLENLINKNGGRANWWIALVAPFHPRERALADAAVDLATRRHGFDFVRVVPENETATRAFYAGVDDVLRYLPGDEATSLGISRQEAEHHVYRVVGACPLVERVFHATLELAFAADYARDGTYNASHDKTHRRCLGNVNDRPSLGPRKPGQKFPVAPAPIIDNPRRPARLPAFNATDLGLVARFNAATRNVTFCDRPGTEFKKPGAACEEVVRRLARQPRARKPPVVHRARAPKPRDAAAAARRRRSGASARLRRAAPPVARGRGQGRPRRGGRRRRPRRVHARGHGLQPRRVARCTSRLAGAWPAEPGSPRPRLRVVSRARGGTTTASTLPFLEYLPRSTATAAALDLVLATSAPTTPQDWTTDIDAETTAARPFGRGDRVFAATEALLRFALVADASALLFRVCGAALSTYDARRAFAANASAAPRPRVVRGDWTLAEDRPGKPGWIATTAGSLLAFDAEFGPSPRLVVVFTRSYASFGDVLLSVPGHKRLHVKGPHKGQEEKEVLAGCCNGDKVTQSELRVVDVAQFFRVPPNATATVHLELQGARHTKAMVSLLSTC
ncbi:hypothetical protein JL720_4415 [Aureococcus anophagefferens]|nr:hypothetical protein JL720_4415 [Aureococcus anophagefferens]